jgi:hypothetical protein
MRRESFRAVREFTRGTAASVRFPDARGYGVQVEHPRSSCTGPDTSSPCSQTCPSMLLVSSPSSPSPIRAPISNSDRMRALDQLS